MNNNSPLPEQMISNWLKGLENDQESILSIHAYAKNILQIEEPRKIKQVCIYAIIRLLAHPDIVATVHHIGGNIEVWDFSSTKVGEILENNWAIYEPPKFEKGDREFILFHKKNLVKLNLIPKQQIVFLKDPPR